MPEKPLRPFRRPSQAILLGDPEVVEGLLNGGADPRIETSRGYPLTMAASLVRVDAC